MKNALFISMLGEREHFRSEDYVSLCESGKEKDWGVDWHSDIAEEAGTNCLESIFAMERSCQIPIMWTLSF